MSVEFVRGRANSTLIGLFFIFTTAAAGHTPQKFKLLLDILPLNQYTIRNRR